MPLFIESTESVASAIVIIRRAIKAGVIDKNDYRDFYTYLNLQKKIHAVKKSHIDNANRDLDIELDNAVTDLFMDQNEELCNMAEELLAEHQKV
jgi:hypothetical protein